MTSRNSTQQISVRLPAKDHQSLVLEAERQGTTVAEIARQRIRQAENQIDLQSMLSSLLKQIMTDTFVITSNVAGLNPDEFESAKENIEKQLKRNFK
ncbi:hypothetical protein KW537_14415 [Vibrio fluvialis]|nr:hypothetical protein [Vibrio fluvialis]RCW20504.1 hypothetical protein DET53_11183 [Vibrio parahaemolyticus]